MSGVKICKTIEGLNSINRTEMELVIWRRTISTSIKDWINCMDSKNLPNFRILVNLSDLTHALESKLKKFDLKVEKMRGQLIDDIYNLASKFADINQCEDVDVRLQRISNDACWKFHRDVVKTRLLTTYCGPSTEWVKNKYSEKALLEQREYNGPLEQLRKFDVAVFKGNYAQPDKGIVHRSPSIVNTGITRLMLCINQRTDTSPAPLDRGKDDLI
ncbi:MAG: hypothetical protein CMF71_05655 [Magnetovibrio sp.]|nr:hypothetical protein [Magnetovibrio sp.]